MYWLMKKSPVVKPGSCFENLEIKLSFFKKCVFLRDFKLSTILDKRPSFKNNSREKNDRRFAMAEGVTLLG